MLRTDQISATYLFQLNISISSQMTFKPTARIFALVIWIAKTLFYLCIHNYTMVIEIFMFVQKSFNVDYLILSSESYSLSQNRIRLLQIKLEINFCLKAFSCICQMS